MQAKRNFRFRKERGQLVREVLELKLWLAAGKQAEA
jgi:hypothetical protein